MADLSEYFNVKALVKDKREYKEMLARTQALPEAYRSVLTKIKGYLLGYATGTGRKVIKKTLPPTHRYASRA